MGRSPRLAVQTSPYLRTAVGVPDIMRDVVLADRLWRGSPPATATTTLQGHVARLRRLLDPGRGAPPPNHNRQDTGEIVRWRVPDGWPVKPVA